MVNLLFLLGDVLEEGFIGIILTLDTLIYGLIGSAFRVFMAIASARLLSSEAYYAIANKVYLVVGVLMLFVLSYGILKAIVNPDEGAKQLGPNLLKKIAIAVIGLAVTPALFNLMYQAQGLVLEHDVLAKLFFRSENTDKIATGGSLTLGGVDVPIDDNINPDDYVKVVGGSYTATTIWQAFFYPAPDSGLTADDITADPSDYYLKAAGWAAACGGVAAGTIAVGVALDWNPIGWIITIGAAAIALTCGLAASNYEAAETGTAITDEEISLHQAYALTAAGESFGLYTIFLDNYLDDGEISYLFGISTLCGAFALYAFASFSIDMGIRAAKLAYFQVIAPIPLVMQILPGKDGVFKDYTKKVIHTFLEVFIRISVVYIVIYLICHLQDLFSSADALWGNTDLSTPELMFAIAFLVIGLIIFCKEAPKFFGETLGINSGNMSLGLKKKLADGGVYNVAGIGAGGLRAATSNWRNYRPPKGKNPSLLARMGSTIAGLGSGAARAAKYQLLGDDKRPSKNWRDAMATGRRASDEAIQKRNDRGPIRDQHAQAEQDMARYQKEYEDAMRAGDTAKAKEAKDRLEEARRRAWEATGLVQGYRNIVRKIDAWTAGTISVEEEQAAIRFGNNLDALKAKTREEAYKKDVTGAQELKRLYDEKKAETIKEYEDGWDEQSANAEYKTRKAAYDSAMAAPSPALTAAQSELSRRKSELESLRARGLTEGNAEYDVAARNLQAAVTELNAQFRTAGVAADIVRANGKVDLFNGVKVDLEEATRQRTLELEGLRIAHEAAADAWVQANAVSNDNIKNAIQTFLTDNASYIDNNKSTRIVVGYTTDPTTGEKNVPVYETLAETLSQAFGQSAVETGRLEFSDDYGKQQAFVLELPARSSIAGTSCNKIIYKKDGSSFIPYAVDDNGVETEVVGSAEWPRYHERDFFNAIKENYVRSKIKKASSQTAIAAGADKGKTAASHITQTSLAEKNRMIRQKEDAAKK